MLLRRLSGGGSFATRHRWPSFSEFDGWWHSFKSFHDLFLLFLTGLFPHINRYAEWTTGLAYDIAIPVDGVDATELVNV
eukprot:7408559-Lingulodinium_polyedra.AAC.1